MTQEELNKKDEKKQENNRNVANNAQALRMAAQVASKSPDPYVGTVAKAVNAADKLTGGKVTEFAGKELEKQKKKLKIKIIVTITSIAIPSLLMLITLFIVVFFVLGLFDIKSEASGGGSSAYVAECNYEGTTVTVMDGSNTKVLASVSLEDYILGVVCPEIGACGGKVASMPEHYLKTKFIATKTYVLARGGYNSATKSITIRASTRDQQWCDLSNGCIVTYEDDTGFHNTYPGNYSQADMIGTAISSYSYTEEDLNILRQYYSDTYGQLYLSTSYTSTINSLGWPDLTQYKADTQLYWQAQASAGKNYIEILDSTATSGKSNASDYVGKALYQLENYCQATPSGSSGDSGESSNASVNYVQWMINFAADNSHGYSMEDRTMNPDVDCSSFVYYALLNNGYTTAQLGETPFATSTMQNILRSIGFEEISYDANSLQEGDILWHPAGFQGKSTGHTEVYIGNGQTVAARNNYDSMPGDSGGQEVRVGPLDAEYQSIFRKK